MLALWAATLDFFLDFRHPRTVLLHMRLVTIIIIFSQAGLWMCEMVK